MESYSNNGVLLINESSAYEMVQVNEIQQQDDNNESKTNLIVNYLPQTFTYDELKSLFGNYGEIESCKLVCDKITGQSLCYGFVNFVNINDADRAAKELNGIKIQNKIIKVSFARPSCESIKGANLYVCGLPKQWTVNEFNCYFSQCGKIITSRILYNQSNNQSKGVGFIRFDQRYEAELAITKLNGMIPILNGTDRIEQTQEPLVVKFANFSDTILLNNNVLTISTLPALNGVNTASNTNMIIDRNQLALNNVYANQCRQVPAIPMLNYNYNNTLPRYSPMIISQDYVSSNTNLASPVTVQAAYANNMNTKHTNDIQAMQMSAASTATSTSCLPPGTGWCIFVYNLAPETPDSLLWQLFGPYGAVQNIKVIRDYQNNKCKGFGFVTMTNYEEAVMAINGLNGFNLGSRILQVSFKKNHQN